MSQCRVVVQLSYFRKKIILLMLSLLFIEETEVVCHKIKTRVPRIVIYLSGVIRPFATKNVGLRYRGCESIPNMNKNAHSTNYKSMSYIVFVRFLVVFGNTFTISVAISINGLPNIGRLFFSSSLMDISWSVHFKGK